MRNFLNFYGHILSTAFHHSWGAFDTVSTLLGVLIPIVAKLHPEWESAMSNLVWQIPLAALSMLFLVRLILAPYWIYSERDKEAARVEAEFTKKITELTSELTRPKFRIKNPKVGESYEGNKYQFDYDLENIGSQAATDLVVKVVVAIASLDQEAISSESSFASEVAINEPLGLSLSLGTLAFSEPAHYFVIAMRYKDLVTKNVYKQIFFIKWQGVKRGEIAQDIILLTQEERQKLEEHLKDLLSDYTSDGAQLSPKVGSIPSS
jgi:hypothetical protein